MDYKNFLELLLASKRKFTTRTYFILLATTFLSLLIIRTIEILYKRYNFSFISDFNSPNIVKYPALVLVFLLSYIIIRYFSERDLRHLCQRNLRIDFTRNKLNEYSNKFDFQGYVAETYGNDRCLFLNNSSEGLITKQTFINYRLTFKAKILNHGFGIIIAAKNLENLFMFRIGYSSDSKILNIIPHIRKDGQWEIQNINNCSENCINILEGTILTFQISSRRGYLELDILSGTRFLINFKYTLPMYFNILPSSENSETETPKGLALKIEWPKYEKVGFRAHSTDEHAIIYELSIEKI